MPLHPTALILPKVVAISNAGSFIRCGHHPACSHLPVHMLVLLYTIARFGSLHRPPGVASGSNHGSVSSSLRCYPPLAIDPLTDRSSMQISEREELLDAMDSAYKFISEEFIDNNPFSEKLWQILESHRTSPSAISSPDLAPSQEA